MSTLVFSTCGTSILTNHVTDDADRKFIIGVTNKSKQDFSQEETNRLNSIIEGVKRLLNDLPHDQLVQCCAEVVPLNILETNSRWSKKGPFEHWLLHTDSEVGRQTATLVQNVIQRVLPHDKNKDPCLWNITGLKTNDCAAFREALSDLTHDLIPYIKAWRSFNAHSGGQVIFNLNGGFKSETAFIQTIAMVYADACVFSFERTNTLLEIPSLPISWESDETIVRKNVDFFRKAVAGYRLEINDLNNRQIPDSLVFRDGYDVCLTHLGEMVWANADLMSREVFPPLSPLLDVSNIKDKFEANEIKSHAKEINRAFDEFCAYLDEHIERMPKQATFKVYEGRSGIWELYAWNGPSAGRVLGHFESLNDGKRKFVCESIGPHD